MRDILEKAYRDYQNRLQQAEKDHAAQEAISKKEHEEVTRKAFFQLFGVEPESVEDWTVTHDGIVLRFDEERWDSGYETYHKIKAHWHIMQQCQECQGLTASRECETLAEIAVQYKEFQPGYYHECERIHEEEKELPPPTKLTRAEELIKALNRIANVLENRP